MTRRPDAGAPGTVVEVHGIKATVLRHEDGARLRARPLRDRTQLAVGDRVVVAETAHGPEVVSLAPRERSLWRPLDRGERLMATHVDRLVVVSAAVPEPRPGLLDRFLVAADLEDIEVVLVLHKVDLPEAERARVLLAPYRALGYPLLETAAGAGREATGLDTLRALLSTGLSVLAGHSGVGKSTLLNHLAPGAALPTAGVNVTTGKGRHTTTVTTSHALGPPWPEGALLVDTPGVRAFGLHGTDLADLAYGFRDLRELRLRCRFRNCLHERESGCAVRDAVASGRVAPERYEGYLRILQSVREGKG